MTWLIYYRQAGGIWYRWHRTPSDDQAEAKSYLDEFRSNNKDFEWKLLESR